MIYLDHNATWAVLPEVIDAMAPWWRVPANPSSPHRAGQAAAAALERAREQVAALVGGSAAGVVFTSGATEANHLGIRGLAALGGAGPVVVSRIEHPCAKAAGAELVRTGRPVVGADVGSDGVVAVGEGWPDDAAGIVLMAANHETGVVQPVEAACAWAAARGAWVHVDASQAAGRVPLRGRPDAWVLSAHKLGGPVGVGALVLRSGDPFPAIFPGVQERARRAGTPPVALAVGFGGACARAQAEQAQRVTQWRGLQRRLEAGLGALGVRVVGSEVERLPNTTCAVFSGQAGDFLVQALDLAGIAVSTGAACASGSMERSPTLTAMGDSGAGQALRFSFGPTTSEADVDAVLQALRGLVGGGAAH